MDLKQLEYIVAIAREKNITWAAQKLHITQPALNQQLLRLEKELKTPLFVRGRNHMELTKAGEIYVKNAEKMLSLKDETYAAIRDLTGNYQYDIKLGLTPERGLHVFSGIYPLFHEKYPNIRLEPMVLSVKEQQTQIEEGNLTMGLVTLSEKDRDDNDYYTLQTNGFVLALPKHPDGSFECPEFSDDILSHEELKRLEKVPLALMWKASTLRRQIDQILKNADCRPKLLFETESTLTIIRMIQAGMCGSIIADYYAIPSDNIRYVKLNLPEHYDVALCMKKNTKTDAAVTYLMELIRDFLNNHHIYEPFS